MRNLGYCGLTISALLFFFSSSVYFVLGIRCRDPVGLPKNTAQSNNPKHDKLCRISIDPALSNVLFVFGSIFLCCGLAVCGFTVLIWYSGRHGNGKEEIENV
jgi:hypothetical protein